jgi:RNA polymerase sigma-70 factor, ECF subfamily
MALEFERSESAPGDADLVTRAKRGEVGAFDALFARHYPRVFNFAHKMVGNADDAADIAQSAFVRAYESMRSLRDGQAFLGWVYRIVVNLVRDRARSAQRKPWYAIADLFHRESTTEEPTEFADATLDPARIARDNARGIELGQAIAGLPLEFRETLTLYHFQGLDVKAIAGIVGVAEGTVKSRLARARMRLRTAMAAWVEDIDTR